MNSTTDTRQTNTEKQELLSGDYHSFEEAISDNDLEKIQYLFEIAKTCGISFATMIKANTYYLLRQCINQNKLEILRHFNEVASQKNIPIYKIFTVQGYNPLANAARHGHLEIVDYLMEIAISSPIDQMSILFDDGDCLAIAQANENEHYTVLSRLVDLGIQFFVPIENMMVALCKYPTKNIQPLIDKLLETGRQANPRTVCFLIRHQKFLSLREAAFNGHISVVNCFLALAVELPELSLPTMYQLAFAAARKGNQAAIMDRIIELSPRIYDLEAHNRRTISFWSSQEKDRPDSSRKKRPRSDTMIENGPGI